MLQALGDLLIELQRRDPEVAITYQGFQIGTFITSISKEMLERLNALGR